MSWFDKLFGAAQEHARSTFLLEEQQRLIVSASSARYRLSKELQDSYAIIAALVRSAGGEISVNEELFQTRDLLDPVRVDCTKNQRIYRVKKLRPPCHTEARHANGTCTCKMKRNHCGSIACNGEMGCGCNCAGCEPPGVIKEKI